MQESREADLEGDETAMMAEIDKVIWDIERCICHVPDACRDCSHYGFDRMECMESLLKDALELLKEQQETIQSQKEEIDNLNEMLQMEYDKYWE